MITKGKYKFRTLEISGTQKTSPQSCEKLEILAGEDLICSFEKQSMSVQFSIDIDKGLTPSSTDLQSVHVLPIAGIPPPTTTNLNTALVNYLVISQASTGFSPSFPFTGHFQTRTVSNYGTS